MTAPVELPAVLLGMVKGPAPLVRPGPRHRRLQLPCNTDPMNPDRRARYQAAATGPDIAAFIDAFELRGNRPVSVENYENDLARLPEMFPDLPLGQVTDTELAQVFRTFPPGGRRVRVAKYNTLFKWARRTRRIAENPMDYFEPPRRKPRSEERRV